MTEEGTEGKEVAGPVGSEWDREGVADVLPLVAQEKPLSGLSGSSSGLSSTWGMPLDLDRVMRDGIMENLLDAYSTFSTYLLTEIRRGCAASCKR